MNSVMRGGQLGRARVGLGVGLKREVGGRCVRRGGVGVRGVRRGGVGSGVQCGGVEYSGVRRGDLRVLDRGDPVRRALVERAGVQRVARVDGAIGPGAIIPRRVVATAHQHRARQRNQTSHADLQARREA
jgi:hypothetical protein